MNLSEEYDKLYQEASEFLKRHNPCQIQDGYCTEYPAFRTDPLSSFRTDPLSSHRYTLCCSNCQYLSKEIGCKVESLPCKFWLCGGAKRKLSPEQMQKWYEMEEKFLKIFKHIYGSRTSKSDFMEKFNYVGIH